MLHPKPHEYEGHQPLLQLRGVCCGYGGKAALQDVDFNVARGDWVGILGPSGSGKSTLLKCILGSAEVYAGDVLFDGESVGRKRPRIGYVPQLETIDWQFPVTVEQVVMMGRTAENGWFPWFKKSEHEAAYGMMERLGILRLARRHIRELSGGEQQRVFLARALVCNPRLLLLDEPTSGLDIKTRDEILHLLDELNHQDVTILMTTHEINAVAAHLPWVVALNGRVVAEGTPAEVFTAPVLKEVYGAEIPVTTYQGMTLVAESPHHLGQTRASGIIHSHTHNDV
ncbi:MAG: metal ABC transporter ATP-binding protein [Chloroflexi bacterium]|nr:metal ABC transporter ATP-binding protein [Chloroflexota bacterium]